MRSVRLTIMLAFAASATSAEAQDAKLATDPVLALVQAFSDARVHFDARALDALLTPDYIEVSPRGEVDRRPAVLGFYAADKAGPVPPMAYDTQDVRRYGDTAIVIGSFSFTVPVPSGGTVTRTVRVTYVERRIGGRWLMASTQFTGVQPAARGAG